MAIYTFWGAFNEHAQGTTHIKAASGDLDIGKSADLTGAEYSALSGLFDLRAGAVSWTRAAPIWRRRP